MYGKRFLSLDTIRPAKVNSSIHFRICSLIESEPNVFYFFFDKWPLVQLLFAALCSRRSNMGQMCFVFINKAIDFNSTPLRVVFVEMIMICVDTRRITPETCPSMCSSSITRGTAAQLRLPPTLLTHTLKESPRLGAALRLRSE